MKNKSSDRFSRGGPGAGANAGTHAAPAAIGTRASLQELLREIGQYALPASTVLRSSEAVFGANSHSISLGRSMNSDILELPLKYPSAFSSPKTTGIRRISGSRQEETHLPFTTTARSQVPASTGVEEQSLGESPKSTGGVNKAFTTVSTPSAQSSWCGDANIVSRTMTSEWPRTYLPARHVSPSMRPVDGLDHARAPHDLEAGAAAAAFGGRHVHCTSSAELCVLPTFNQGNAAICAKSSSEDESDEDSALASCKAIASLAAAASAPQRTGCGGNGITNVQIDGIASLFAPSPQANPGLGDRASNHKSLRMPMLGVASVGAQNSPALDFGSESNQVTKPLVPILAMKLDLSRLVPRVIEGTRPDDYGRQPPTPTAVVVERLKASSNAKASSEVAALSAGQVENVTATADEGAFDVIASGLVPLRPSSHLSLLRSTSWAVDGSEIKYGRRIGAGAFGEVYEAEWRRSRIAVKRLHTLHPLQEKTAQHFFAEMEILANARHDHIVHFLGGCIQPDNLCILLEYCPQARTCQALPPSSFAA